jgi:hypothetical protein
MKVIHFLDVLNSNIQIYLGKKNDMSIVRVYKFIKGAIDLVINAAGESIVRKKLFWDE